jgi:hypothetical protein
MKTQRSLRVLSDRKSVWKVIELKTDRKTANYAVIQRNKAVEWWEVGTDNCYHVTTDGCDCKGFNYHGACKHKDATAKLRQIGVLI